jgi:dTDP-4-amino-4,6-dideoxygalactose transaminase
MIPFVDLNREHAPVKDEIMAAIDGVIARGDFILGKDTALFENEFAAYCGTKFAVGLASGTDALFYSLKALDMGKGDKVITAANTFIATALAISNTGAEPVLIDCDEKAYNIDCEKLKSYLKRTGGKKVKAIIPVHLYGQPAPMKEILALAGDYGVRVVEDACQAHGAFYDNKRTGSLGDCGCFSFYPAKNLGCFGDGGMVTTNNKKIFEKLLMLRNYGQKKKYYHLVQGYNSRLDTLQAAVLRVKLRYLDGNNDLRRKHAALYGELLKDSAYALPQEAKRVKHVYHLYVVRAKNRNRLQEFMAGEGVSCGIHYPVPIHLSKAYSCLGLKKGSFPVTEKLSGQILSLPMFASLENEEIEKTAALLRRFQ